MAKSKIKILPPLQKFKPPSATKLLRNRNLIRAASEDKKVVDLVVKGKSFDEIGQELGISASDAFNVSRKAIDRWTKEFGIELEQARELDAKRLDALLVILWGDVEPKPMMDDKGNPVINQLTGDVVMSAADKHAIKLILDVLERRAKLYGLDAAVKMESRKIVDVVERRYIGVKIEGL